MPGSEIILYFTLPDRDYIYAREFIAKEQLRAEHDIFNDCVGGLAIEGEGGPIFVEDDFDHIIAALLVAAPDQLERGEHVVFEYYYDPEVLDIRVADDVATFSDGQGARVSMPVAQAVTELKRAHDEMTKLKELVGA
ncbi:hypothetical protein ACERZ8_20200 [Tateyamaria armeniaca]|uniref:YCII-related domain-containing protein n=1 Tax=Tateyamaria armeniaca TaxID=2518930 RepID=A0ABW8V1G2_9RHOB